jgi:hypothetical protein
MTRDQALEALHGISVDAWLVDELERLGLLKLEEPAPVSHVLHVSVCPHANRGLSDVAVHEDALIGVLRKAGSIELPPGGDGIPSP